MDILEYLMTQGGADEAQQAREAAMLQRRNQLLRNKPQRDAGFQPEPLSPEHRNQMTDINNAIIGAGAASLPTSFMYALGPAGMLPLAMAGAGGYAGYHHRRNSEQAERDKNWPGAY